MVHPQRRHPNHKPAGSRSIDTRPRAACSWRTTGPSIRSALLPAGFPVFKNSFWEFGKNLDNLDSGKNDYVGLSFHARP